MPRAEPSLLTDNVDSLALDWRSCHRTGTRLSLVRDAAVIGGNAFQPHMRIVSSERNS